MNRQYEIHKALAVKPAIGEPCNHCGWCCLRETCAVGAAVTPEGELCTQLVKRDDGYFCRLGTSKTMREIMAMGQGCDAISTKEKIEMLIRTGVISYEAV